MRPHTTFVVLGGVALALAPVSAASAHIGEFSSTAEALRAWRFDPLVVVPLLVLAYVYGRGAGRLLRATPSAGRYGWRIFAYGAGLFTLVVALLSPLDSLSSMYASAHMVQHLVLMQVAAPLLVLGAPLVVATVGSPALRRLVRDWRRRPRLRLLAFSIAPLSILVLHGLSLTAWHMPVLYNLTLTSEAIHVLQHAAFLGTAMLFWWVVLPSPGSRPNHPVSFGLIFVMAVLSGGVGALMTVAPAPWYDYPAYAGLSPLEDQQLAGAIMWVIGGTMYAVTAVTVVALWMRQAEERVRGTESATAEAQPAGELGGGV